MANRFMHFPPTFHMYIVCPNFIIFITKKWRK